MNSFSNAADNVTMLNINHVMVVSKSIIIIVVKPDIFFMKTLLNDFPHLQIPEELVNVSVMRPTKL